MSDEGDRLVEDFIVALSQRSTEELERIAAESEDRQRGVPVEQQSTWLHGIIRAYIEVWR